MFGHLRIYLLYALSFKNKVRKGQKTVFKIIIYIFYLHNNTQNIATYHIPEYTQNYFPNSTIGGV